jgi:hypothetical protein
MSEQENNPMDLDNEETPNEPIRVVNTTRRLGYGSVRPMGQMIEHNWPHDPAVSKFNLGLLARSLTPGAIRIQLRGLLNRYDMLDSSFGPAAFLLSNGLRQVKNTIWDRETDGPPPPAVRDEVTNEVLLSVGKGSRCKKCHRDVPERSLDPKTRECAYGSDSYTTCAKPDDYFGEY